MINANTILDPDLKKGKGKAKVVKTKGKALNAASAPVSQIYRPTTYFSDKQIPGAGNLKMGQKVALVGTVVGTSERTSKDGTQRNYDVEIRSAVMSKKKAPSKNAV